MDNAAGVDGDAKSNSDSWEGAGEGKLVESCVVDEGAAVGVEEVGGDEDEDWVGDTGVGIDVTFVVEVIVDGAEVGAGAGRPVGRPCCCRAFTTASQPRSSVLILSFNSSFSRSRSRSCATRCASSVLNTGITCGEGTIGGATWERRGIWRPGAGTYDGGGAAGRPARSRRFSSSSSATRRSSQPNCAFRRSRLFWAAIRFLCARASLRSSEDISDLERFRGGWSGRAEVDVDGEGDSQDGDGECAEVVVKDIWSSLLAMSSGFSSRWLTMMRVKVKGMWKRYCARAGRGLRGEDSQEESVDVAAVVKVFQLR